MRRIGLIVAMQKEWDAIFTQYEREGRQYAFMQTFAFDECVALLSGIGKVNAAVCAYQLIKEHYVDEILSFGCAGGMTNSVSVGDVIVGDTYCYHDVWCGEPNERGQVQGAPMIFPSNWKEWEWLCEGCEHGLIATGDSLCDNEIMASAIVQILGMNPIAVDMESAAIAQVCFKYGIPFTSVRVISDNPLLGRHADEYKDFWARKDKTLEVLMRKLIEEPHEGNRKL